MSLRLKRASKELEIISLIDVVFLLIIFALTVSLYVKPRESEGVPPTQGLHIEFSRTAAQEEVALPPLRVRIYGAGGTGQVFPDTATFPTDGELLALDEDAFRSSRACDLLRNKIEYFFTETMTRDGGEREMAERPMISLTGDTKFRVVGFVLEELATYESQAPEMIISSDN